MELEYDEVTANIINTLSEEDNIFVSMFKEQLRPKMEKIFMLSGQRNVIVKRIYNRYGKNLQFNDAAYCNVISDFFEKMTPIEM